MTLTAVQRRALLESDANTGQLGAREPTCAALARQGLAVRYGRTGGYYLTQEGRRVRTELARVEPPAQESGVAPAVAPGPEPEPVPEPGFAADDGHGTGTAAPRRAAEVASAWSGLLEIRRVLQDGDTTRPAPWERERLVHAVALALEAAGRPPSRRDAAGRPSATGYAVAPSAQSGVAEVSWHSPAGDAAGTAEAELTRCQGVLEAYGWQCTLHHDRRRRAFLLVSPRRA
ncbi:hypothetical protein [Actinacidiphila glaucinigra]|uniref:hypothetical protein n=1 Tax=Actinacidiphila glaucinigra TaxID=235986 RepID=UPI0029A76E34|nr:hypothetical protein [Streptomyces sp. PA03-3a]